MCTDKEPDPVPASPLETVQIARGWLQLRSDDLPGPIVVCVAREALGAAQAAAVAFGPDWPALPDGSQAAAPLFTPSEVDELFELSHPPPAEQKPPADLLDAAPKAPGITSSAAEPRCLPPADPVPAERLGERDDDQGARGELAMRPRWDRLPLLRAVVAAKRALGARVVPLAKAGALATCALEEDQKFVENVRALIAAKKAKAPPAGR
jgi:hypothetical protein